MQPYFFPYVGYFALMSLSDEWVALDVTQYTPQSWMNRNRILHPTNGWMYITAPVVRAPEKSPIEDMRLVDIAATKAAIVGRLSHYKRTAPHYADVTDLVVAAFGACHGDSLAELNVSGLKAVLHYLGVGCRVRVCSEMGLDLSGVSHAGGWAPAIASALGADEYVNPIRGRGLFRPADFANAGIRLRFLRMPSVTYPTNGFGFEPDLSILDVLMWNSPAQVKALLEAAELIDAADAANAANPGGPGDAGDPGDAGEPGG
jgi:hypothetical protein